MKYLDLYNNIIKNISLDLKNILNESYTYQVGQFDKHTANTHIEYSYIELSDICDEFITDFDDIYDDFYEICKKYNDTNKDYPTSICVKGVIQVIQDKSVGINMPEFSLEDIVDEENIIDIVECILNECELNNLIDEDISLDILFKFKDIFDNLSVDNFEEKE